MCKIPFRSPLKGESIVFCLLYNKKRRLPTLLVRFLGRRKSLAGELVECLPTLVYAHISKIVCLEDIIYPHMHTSGYI